MPADAIATAPTSLDAWAALLPADGLPVLGETAAALEELRAAEDDVDAHLLGETLAGDPLLTVKVLAHVAQLRRGRDGGEPETLTAALVMLGITPFFRAFGPQASVEQLLADRPDALAGLQRVLRRSHRAARFALGFAVHRMDHDAAVIHEAALLHDIAELLLWLRAPTLALAIAARQQADPTLRSAVVQKELLHVTLADLQQRLMRDWRLPALLVRIGNDHGQASDAQLRNVHLAIRLARHSADGWDNAALPDDLREIGELLNLGPEPTLRLVREIDAD